MFLPDSLREPMPQWLKDFAPDAAFPLGEFFRSRVVYYPGSGHDGQPVVLFGSAHAAHCFVYADYGVSQSALERELNSLQDGFRGYRSLARVTLKASDLTPDGWIPHVKLSRDVIESSQRAFQRGFVRPFGLIEVLERVEPLDDSHGPQRLAILFLGADGIATNDALFCQGRYPAPFAMVIQEHGFGGNYNAFGHGSLIEQIPGETSTYPEWMLVGENSEGWDGYEPVPNLQPTRGGVHSMKRVIYRRCDL